MDRNSATAHAEAWNHAKAVNYQEFLQSLVLIAIYKFVIPGAILIPLGQLETEWVQVKDANEVVAYCALGARSLQAAAFLRSKGVFNATSMDGGIIAWTNAGGTTISKEA